MNYTIQAVIRQGEQRGYVAECLDLPVVTQGNSLDEVTDNLREAIALYFEGESMESAGFVANPPLLISMELEPLRAQA